MRSVPARPNGHASSRRCGLIAVLALPLRGARRGRRPARPARRHDPEPRLAQPVPDRRTSSATRSSPSTTTCSSASARTSSRSPASPSRGRSATATPGRSRSGRHEVVGRPAGDVRGRPLDDPDVLDGQKAETATRRRLPRPVPDLRRRHRGRRARPDDARRDDVRAEQPQILTSRTSRSCPSTSGRSRDDRRPTSERRRRSSAPARTRSSSGRPASTSGSSATRTTGDPRAAEDEIVFQFFKNDGHDDPRPSRPATSTTPATSPSDQFDSLKGLPNIVTVESSLGAEANAFTQLNFNTTASRSRAAARRRRRSRTRSSGTRSATPSTRQALVDKVLGGHGLVGSTIIPPVDGGRMAPRADQPPHVRHRARQVEARRGRLHARRHGKRLDKEGKPINLRMVVPGRRRPTARRRSSSPTGSTELGIKVDAAPDNEAMLGAEYCRPKPIRRARPTRHGHLGLGRRSDPNSLLQILTTDAIGSSSDSLGRTRRTTSCTTQQAEATDPVKRKALDRPRCSSCSTTRRRTTSLYYDAELHAYRTDKFGGWQIQPTERRHAVLRLRLARLHAC